MIWKVIIRRIERCDVGGGATHIRKRVRTGTEELYFARFWYKISIISPSRGKYQETWRMYQTDVLAIGVSFPCGSKTLVYTVWWFIKVANLFAKRSKNSPQDVIFSLASAIRALHTSCFFFASCLLCKEQGPWRWRKKLEDCMFQRVPKSSGAPSDLFVGGLLEL